MQKMKTRCTHCGKVFSWDYLQIDERPWQVWLRTLAETFKLNSG